MVETRLVGKTLAVLIGTLWGTASAGEPHAEILGRRPWLSSAILPPAAAALESIEDRFSSAQRLTDAQKVPLQQRGFTIPRW
jgi:hypothetical protein